MDGESDAAGTGGARDDGDARGGRLAHPFRSDCSIARALEVVGDRWTLLVVRDLMWHGRHTFSGLAAAAENIPTNILADRLRRLEAWGLVERSAYSERPPRHAYRLTPAGRALEPALLAIMRFGHDALGGGLFDPASGVSTGAARRGPGER